MNKGISYSAPENLNIPIEFDAGLDYFGPEQHISDMAMVADLKDNPLQILCEFRGVWDGELEDVIRVSSKVLYTDRKYHKDYLYEVYDLSSCPIIKKMPEALGFVKGLYSAKIQYQRPGCLIPRHADPLHIFSEIPEDLLPKAIRVLIMLADWEYGQIMGFNNVIWREWSKGTTIYCDFLDTQHFTANGSWHGRPILQVTGVASDELLEQIKNKQFRIINLD